MKVLACEWCGKEQRIYGKRADTYRFCSYECRGKWRTANWSQENNPAWQGGERKKLCQNCGEIFEKPEKRAISVFRKQRFCCHECGVEGREISGQDNPNWKGGKASRPSQQRTWAQAVISRDRATCRKCGISGVELHAHHLLPFKKFPEKRWDLDNGLTLCSRCHWDEHTARDANAVNSGKPLTVGAEGNPEPSLGGNTREGVTTRGRAYRRWEGECPTCGAFISKRLSDVAGRSFVACSRTCAGKHNQKLRRSMAVTPPRAPHAKAMI